jgi:CheY-like chemotaxis protein
MNMDKSFTSQLDGIIAASKTACRLRSCLYVEDSYANLLLVQQLIARRSDMKLLTANTGLLGVQMAKDFHPDIIFMDINLPGVNGMEALEMLRADPATAQIPVTALSSNAYPTQIEEGLRHGFFRYLTKPFKIDEFMAALDDMLLRVAIFQ